MTWPRASAFTGTPTEASTSATGTRTSSMDSERRSGTMAASMLDSTKMHQRKARASTDGLMEIGILASGAIICSTAKGCLCGTTIDSISETGTTTWCMAKVLIGGETAECSSVSMWMTERVALAFIYGLMVEHIMASGYKVSNTAKVSTLYQTLRTHSIWKSRRADGSTASVRSGWTKSLRKSRNSCELNTKK